MHNFETKFTIGDTVAIKHDVAGKKRTVKGIYIDRTGIQYYVSDGDNSGYEYADDLIPIE